MILQYELTKVSNKLRTSRLEAYLLFTTDSLLTYPLPQYHNPTFKTMGSFLLSLSGLLLSLPIFLILLSQNKAPGTE